jgi:hypothetical protein
MGLMLEYRIINISNTSYLRARKTGAMSNVKTGITVRDSLKSLFSTVCHEGNVRFIKVQLSDGACGGFILTTRF